MADGRGIPLDGDRSAFDAENYASLHANDVDEAAGMHHTLGTGATQAAAGNHTHAVPQIAMFAVEGALTTGAKALRIYNVTGASRTISKVYIAVNIAPTGASITVDIHKDGTTIFTNQAHRPSITATNYTGVTTTIDVATWADGSYLTMEIDAIGSTLAGSDLTVHVLST